MKKLLAFLFAFFILILSFSFFSQNTFAACSSGVLSITCPAGTVKTQVGVDPANNYQACYSCVASSKPSCTGAGGACTYGSCGSNTTVYGLGASDCASGSSSYSCCKAAAAKPSCTGAGGTCTYGSCGTDVTVYGLGASDCAQNSASYSCCKKCPANTSTSVSCPTGTVKTQAGGGAPTGCYYCKVNTANICNSTNGGTCVYSSPGCAGSTPPLSVKTGSYYCTSSDSVNSGGLRSDMQCCAVSGTTSPTDTCTPAGETCTSPTFPGTCNEYLPGSTLDTTKKCSVSGMMCCKCPSGQTLVNGKCTSPPNNPPISNPPPGPAHTILNLIVGLDGVGHVGDQANTAWEARTNTATINGLTVTNPVAGSNQSPLTTPRAFVINIGSTSHNASLTFDTTDGVYKGSLDLGTSFATDDYPIKISTAGHLVKAVANNVHITSNVTTAVPQTNLVTGDITGTSGPTPDNALSVLDYNILISCIQDPDIDDFDNRATCNLDANYVKRADLEDNGAIDKFDYNLFVREFSKILHGD